MQQITGKTLQVVHRETREGDVGHNLGSPSKAEEIMGFEARISLREGLDRATASYLHVM